VIDLDHPDTFTWLRGFVDMRSRLDGLEAFYCGDIWAQHRDAANATMIDSDDVRLLDPLPSYAPPARGINDRRSNRPRQHRVITYQLIEPASSELVESIRHHLERVDGWTLELLAVTLDQPNDFPALPVREGESVVVAVMSGDHLPTGPDPLWRPPDGPADFAIVDCDTFRLVPTTRSRLE